MGTNVSYEWGGQEELQRLQEEFCRATGVCAYCLDKDMNRLTAVSGTEGQISRLQEYGERGLLKAVLERVEEGSLEEQAVEELGGNGDKAAAIAVKQDGKTVIYWLVAWIASEGKSGGALFLNVLDLLCDTSRILFEKRVPSAGGEAESRHSRFAGQEPGAGSKSFYGGQEQAGSKRLYAGQEPGAGRHMAAAEIVRLLGSDERMEAVMGKWLDIVAGYLEVDTALLFQLNQDKNTVDVLSEWCSSGVVSYFDRSRDQRMKYPWLLSDKPLVYSYDAREDEYWRALKAMGVKACMIFPVLCPEKGRGIVLTLNHRTRGHSFSSQEIAFVEDAVKMLQSILAGQIQKSLLAGAYDTLENILDNVVCGIYVEDAGTKEPLFINKRLQSVFGPELKDKTFEGLLRKGMEKGAAGGRLELCHEEKERWYDLTAGEIAWVNGKQAMLYSLYDITERKLYRRRMEQQANTDFLTGLYNRMCCERDLARQVDEAKRAGQTGALLYLDLDDFKHINDGLGHQYGDALLKAIAHELQRVRGIEKNCYRVGGDEFIVLVSHGEYAEIDRIVEGIRQIFAKPWFLKDADYYCTMSMGIVTFPGLGDSVTDLVKKADIAMYEAKKGGKNRVASYSSRLDSMSGRRLDMEKNMRDATADGYREFEIYYQPIINVQGGQGTCAGAEALIRWNSARLGFIPPDEFIPLAEYLGLINPIGNYVMREACLQCKKWNENGYPDYKVNVNLSVVQLLQTDVVETVERTLEETGIQPRNLTLEVTESLAINDMGRMKEILNRIKALGVKIALDDFGTGYSSLNHIREIPFDMIKVDQSFVKELAADAYSQSFVKMVAELAETLGVSICVEGIETPAQYKVVQKMKVKYIQGYYFDRPMKQADFEEKYCRETKMAI